MVNRTLKQKLMYYSNPRFFEKEWAKLEDTEEKVAYLLLHKKNCRNDDTYLITEFWRVFNGHKAVILPLIPEQRVTLTNAESITRCRRKLQQLARKNPDLSYMLPDSEEVIEKRQMKEELHHNYWVDH